MDQKGQISAEFILLVAIVLAMVLVFATIVSDQNEMNTIATTARIAADNATTQMAVLNTGKEPVRVTKTNMNGTQNVDIDIILSSSTDDTQKQNILNVVMQSLKLQGFNVGTTSNPPSVTVSTIRHFYTITVN